MKFAPSGLPSSLSAFLLRKNLMIEELRRKSKEEIQKVLRDDREKLRQLRFDLITGKVKNVREIRKVKKEIAQILTLLTELRGSGAKVKKSAKKSFSSFVSSSTRRTKSSSPQG
ncbi:MAG: 50S ribosomal protein L29 [bacterium]|nr:50S ribosomal protein L29 [bacterium]